jgi:hypothetical protein
MSPPDLADVSTGAIIEPMPRRTMPAANIREEVITPLLHAYTIGPHRDKVSTFLMARAKAQLGHLCMRGIWPAERLCGLSVSRGVDWLTR